MATLCARHLARRCSSQHAASMLMRPGDAGYVSGGYTRCTSVKPLSTSKHHTGPTVPRFDPILLTSGLRPSNKAVLIKSSSNTGIIATQILTRAQSSGQGGNEEKTGTGKKGSGTLKYVLLFATVGSACAAFLYTERKLEEIEKELEKKNAGQPRCEGSNDPLPIGGRFDLIDTSGKRKTIDDFLGQWILLYFGYTRCPDDCSEEIKKMITAVNKINSHPHYHLYEDVVPIFISIDTERDDLKTIEAYVKGFDPKLVGLTGSKAKINEVREKFRVKSNRGPEDTNKDYKIDHSVALYLISPLGDCVDTYGHEDRADEPEHVECSIASHMNTYIEKHNGLRLQGICVNM